MNGPLNSHIHVLQQKATPFLTFCQTGFSSPFLLLFALDQESSDSQCQSEMSKLTNVFKVCWTHKLSNNHNGMANDWLAKEYP